MIRTAADFQGQLTGAWGSLLFDPAFRYYTTAYPRHSVNLPESEWDRLAYVSVTSDGRLVGYLGASIDRANNTVDELEAFNLYMRDTVAWKKGPAIAARNCAVYSRDLGAFLSRIICGGWDRISWSVCVGNPAEKMYDRFAEQVGGRVVGTRRKWRRCRITGVHLDSKMYEVIPSEVPEAWMKQAQRLDFLRASGGGA